MIYFGQEVGEPGAENAGFGSPTRTSIFDYIGVPHHQRWMNEGKFDGGKSTLEEKNLRDFYKRLLNLAIKSEALMGAYQEIHEFNRGYTEWYNDKVFSFVRWNENEKLIIVSNFSSEETYGFDLGLPNDIVAKWELNEGSYQFKDQLHNNYKSTLNVNGNDARIRIDIKPLESFILKLK